MWLRLLLLCLCIGGIAGQANNGPKSNHPSQMKGKSGFQKIITKTVTALFSGSNNASIPYTTAGTTADMGSQFSTSDLLPYDDDASSSSTFLGLREILSSQDAGISSSTYPSLFDSTLAGSVLEPVGRSAGVPREISTYTPTILCTTGTLNALSVLESAKSSLNGIAPTGSPLPACPVDPGTLIPPAASSSTPSSSSYPTEGSGWSTTTGYSLTTITIHQDTTSSSTPSDSAWSTTTVILDSSTATFMSPFGSSSWYSPVSFASPAQSGVSLSPLATSTAQWSSTSPGMPPVSGVPISDGLPSGPPSSSTSITSTYFSYDPLLTISPAADSTLSTSITYSGVTGVTSSVSNGPGSSTLVVVSSTATSDSGTIASSIVNSQSSVVSNSASSSSSVSTASFSSGTQDGPSSSTTTYSGSSSQSASGTTSVVSIGPGSSSTMSISVENSAATSSGTSVTSSSSSFTSATLTNGVLSSSSSVSTSPQGSSTTDSQGFVVPVVPLSRGSAAPESFTEGLQPTNQSSMASLATSLATSSGYDVVPSLSTGSAQPSAWSLETLSSTDAQGSIIDVTLTHTVLTTDSDGNTVPLPLASSNGGGQFTSGFSTTSQGAGVSGPSTVPPNPGSQPTTGAQQTMPQPSSTTDSNGVVMTLPSGSGSASATITSLTTYTGYPADLSFNITSAANNTSDPQNNPVFAGGQDCLFCPEDSQGFILFGLHPGVYKCSEHPPHFPGSDSWPDTAWPELTILPDGTPRWGPPGDCGIVFPTFTTPPSSVSWSLLPHITGNGYDKDKHPVILLAKCWFCPHIDIEGITGIVLFGFHFGLHIRFPRPPHFPKLPEWPELEWPKDIKWPDLKIDPDGTPHFPDNPDPSKSPDPSSSTSTTDSTTSTTSSTTSSESSSCEIETATHYTEYCPSSTSGGSSVTCTMTSSTVVSSCSATAATTTVTAAPACTKGLDYSEPQGDNGDPDVAVCDATIDYNADQGSDGTPPNETASTSSASSASSTTMDAAASSSAWASVNSAASEQSARLSSLNSVASSNALAGISSAMASVSLSQAQVTSWLTQPFTTTQWTTSCGSGSADCSSTYTIITLGPTSDAAAEASRESVVMASTYTPHTEAPPDTSTGPALVMATSALSSSCGSVSLTNPEGGYDWIQDCTTYFTTMTVTAPPPPSTRCHKSCSVGPQGVYAGCATYCSVVPTDPPNLIARPWGTGNSTYGGWLNGTAFTPSGRMTRS
ncbi:hypothetical protein LTR56_008101 [Elasticomyces elasticus]|nr:hypothetical protein LTR56_008101 [Elasticomyces elasticus]